MYTPKDLKNEGQHIFFKLLSFVIYSNLLYVVLLFLTVMIYARIRTVSILMFILNVL